MSTATQRCKPRLEEAFKVLNEIHIKATIEDITRFYEAKMNILWVIGYLEGGENND